MKDWGFSRAFMLEDSQITMELSRKKNYFRLWMALGFKNNHKSNPCWSSSGCHDGSWIRAPRSRAYRRAREHGVSAMCDHLPNRKRKKKKKLLCYCLVLYCILFPFFSFLVKRLHFVAIVVAQDQGSAARDLQSHSDSLGCGTCLQTFVCRTVSSTRACIRSLRSP